MNTLHCRLLSKAEIQELLQQGEIKPIQAIRRSSGAYIPFGARFEGGGYHDRRYHR